MELKFKKFLSLVLTFTLLLSFFNGVSFKYSAFNAYASIDEDMEDAAVDEASISFKAGDWKQAARDGCAPNFFHNAVQNYLSDVMNGYGYGKEKRINYNQLVENPVTKIKSSYGSADVYKEIDADTFYVWEVKPYSYNNSENAKLALKQLANYTNSELH